MIDSSALRITQDSEELEKLLPLKELTPQDSARQWLVLQQAFEGQLKDTEAIFAGDRREALVELQRHLKKLAEWQADNG
jgi:hypothetical protein